MTTAIITLGICAIICTAIICGTVFCLDITRRAHRDAGLALWKCIIRFINEFNNEYENTHIKFTVDNDGTPHITAYDVEPEEAE